MLEKIYNHEIDQLRETVQNPEWYKDFNKLRRNRLLGAAAIANLKPGQPEPFMERVKNGLYDAFERLLAEEVVALGTAGYNWDSERQPLEKIIIHHTSRQPGLTKERLNAMHLIRLYVPVYQNPSPADKPRIDGQPIYSGHFREGKQVFWGYHWLIRSDGEAESLLNDAETGWQVGKWPINCQSIAICVDDDLTHDQPGNEVMDGIVGVIKQNYSHLDITPETLLGHGEVNETTDCPGDQFIGGWKLELLDRLDA